MSEFEKIDARGAIVEIRNCCDRIASALDESAGEAEQLGDREMLDRLIAAKEAAHRACDLVARLEQVLQTEEATSAQSSK